MSIVKAETFRSQSADELKAKLVELKKEQFNLRFKVASGEMDNPSRMRIVRREIARIKTVLGENKIKQLEKTEKPPPSQMRCYHTTNEEYNKSGDPNFYQRHIKGKSGDKHLVLKNPQQTVTVEKPYGICHP